MSSVPNCCVCKYFNLNEKTCKIYPEGIPRDVYVEIVDCNEYCYKPYEEDPEIPTIKRIPGTPFYEVIEKNK